MTNWYDYPTSLLYGQPQANGGVENGVDIQTPFHTPITALIAGWVSAINKDPWGGTVTVQTAPFGGVFGGSTYSYYTHLDTFANGLHVGQNINVGDLIGLSGGQVTGGNMPSGSYSTGPHIEFGLTNGPAFGHGSAFQSGPTVDPLLDPISTLNNFRSSANQISEPSTSGNSGPTVGDLTSNPIGTILGSVFSADIMQRTIIVILALILIVVGVVVLFKQGTSVQKTEVAS